MSKICERVALNQLIAYMKNKKRLTEHQSGNKAQHSTLSFDEHILSVTSACLSSLIQINRVKHVLDRNTLLTLSVPWSLANSIIVHQSGLV